MQVDLKNHLGYSGSLDCSPSFTDGQCLPYYADNSFQIIYHVPTLSSKDSTYTLSDSNKNQVTHCRWFPLTHTGAGGLVGGFYVQMGWIIRDSLQIERHPPPRSPDEECPVQGILNHLISSHTFRSNCSTVSLLKPCY